MNNGDDDDDDDDDNDDETFVFPQDWFRFSKVASILSWTTSARSLPSGFVLSPNSKTVETRSSAPDRGGNIGRPIKCAKTSNQVIYSA